MSSPRLGSEAYQRQETPVEGKDKSLKKIFQPPLQVVTRARQRYSQDSRSCPSDVPESPSEEKAPSQAIHPSRSMLPSGNSTGTLPPVYDVNPWSPGKGPNTNTTRFNDAQHSFSRPRSPVSQHSSSRPRSPVSQRKLVQPPAPVLQPTHSSFVLEPPFRLSEDNQSPKATSSPKAIQSAAQAQQQLHATLSPAGIPSQGSLSYKTSPSLSPAQPRSSLEARVPPTLAPSSVCPSSLNSSISLGQPLPRSPQVSLTHSSGTAAGVSAALKACGTGSGGIKEKIPEDSSPQHVPEGSELVFVPPQGLLDAPTAELPASRPPRKPLGYRKQAGLGFHSSKPRTFGERPPTLSLMYMDDTFDMPASATFVKEACLTDPLLKKSGANSARVSGNPKEGQKRGKSRKHWWCLCKSINVQP